MKRTRVTGLIVACVFAVVSAAAVPAFAQMGSLKGKVVDAQGNPVADAELVFEYVGGYTLKMTAKTNARGEWVRSGMQATSEGYWNITVTKGDLGAKAQAKASIGETIEVPNIIVRPGAPRQRPRTRRKRRRPGRPRRPPTSTSPRRTPPSPPTTSTARSRHWRRRSRAVPTCATCYAKMGEVYNKKPDLPNAEKAFLKAVELDPKLAAAYDMLASIYNTQKKFDDAGKMSAKANELRAATGGGGDANSSFNAGVIAWNQGKMDEAQSNFEKAIALDPKLAEAHYQLGMTYVNQNKLPEAKKALQQYLQLAPDGKNAATAKAVSGSI